MAQGRHRIRLGIVVLPGTSAALALLLQSIFRRADRLAGGNVYDISILAACAHGTTRPAIDLQLRPARGRYDYLLLPPLDEIEASYKPDNQAAAFIAAQHAKGSVVASACLGALTIAATGLLDDAEATTHWAWAEAAQQRYPRVRWAAHRMICDNGQVITAGGYLGVVDLALHIVERTIGRRHSHELGRRLLADSARQRRSVFAQQLIAPEVQHGPLQSLPRWIERNLEHAPTTERMAERCGMSLRSFHRHFVEAFRVTPHRFIQLKRIERAQRELRETRRSVEQILAGIGVSDVAAFRRVFQRELGCSPAEYRRRLLPEPA